MVSYKFELFDEAIAWSILWCYLLLNCSTVMFSTHCLTLLRCFPQPVTLCTCLKLTPAIVCITEVHIHHCITEVHIHHFLMFVTYIIFFGLFLQSLFLNNHHQLVFFLYLLVSNYSQQLLVPTVFTNNDQPLVYLLLIYPIRSSVSLLRVITFDS